MTLTGRQIRQTRKLLSWSRIKFSESTSLTQAMVAAIESADGPAWLTEEQENAIRRGCEQAGIEFTDAQPGVRLKDQRAPSS